MIEEKLLIYTNELLRLQRAFNASRVAVIHLKGITQYYALTGLWPKNCPIDIDILIPPNSFLKASRILSVLGFSKHHSQGDFSVRPQISFVKALPLMPIVCDVHNKVFFPTKYIFNVLPEKLVKRIGQKFFLRAKIINFHNQKFKILDRDDMLLHQSLNFFFHHSCRNPHQLRDIALITKKENINWEIVLKRLTLWNLKEFAYYPIFLSKQIEKAKVPDLVLRALKPKNILARFAPIFINSSTALSPIQNLHVRFRYNILLRFLIADQPLFEKIFSVCSPRILQNIIKKPRWLFYLLPSIFPTRAKPSE